MYTQNGLALLLFILSYNLVASPYLGLRGDLYYDSFNLSKKTEKTYMNDYRFTLPLQMMIFLETISWIWALIVCSDKVKFDNHWLNPDISTFSKYLIFTFVYGFFTGLSAICGHELVHKKDPINKAIGTWAFTKFFYTHFLDDHFACHHKYVATPEDCGTARKNEPLYKFILRAQYMANTGSWNREVKRIKKEFGKNVPLPIMLFNNRMLWCIVFHFTIVTVIYLLLGW